MSFFTRLCVAYAFWKFVRAVETFRWPFSRKVCGCRGLATSRTCAKPTFETLPNLAGISANDYFRARINHRAQHNTDLSDSAFLAWRAKNNH